MPCSGGRAKVFQSVQFNNILLLVLGESYDTVRG